jgi:hypothetical protein
VVVEAGGVLLGSDEGVVDEGEVVLEGLEVLFGSVLGVVLDGLALDGCCVVVSVVDGVEVDDGVVVLDGEVLDGVVWLWGSWVGVVELGVCWSVLEGVVLGEVLDGCCVLDGC